MMYMVVYEMLLSRDFFVTSPYVCRVTLCTMESRSQSTLIIKRVWPGHDSVQVLMFMSYNPILPPRCPQYNLRVTTMVRLLRPMVGGLGGEELGDIVRDPLVHLRGRVQIVHPDVAACAGDMFWREIVCYWVVQNTGEGVPGREEESCDIRVSAGKCCDSFSQIRVPVLVYPAELWVMPCECYACAMRGGSDPNKQLEGRPLTRTDRRPVYWWDVNKKEIASAGVIQTFLFDK